MMFSKQIIKRKIPVTAIYEDEVITLLKKINLYDDVVNRKTKCIICGKTITFENIGGFIGVNGKIYLVCNEPKCIIQAAKLSSKEQ